MGQSRPRGVNGATSALGQKRTLSMSLQVSAPGQKRTSTMSVQMSASGHKENQAEAQARHLLSTASSSVKLLKITGAALHSSTLA